MHTVLIDRADIPPYCSNDIHLGLFLLRRLKQSDIPILGALHPTGVLHGTLVRTDTRQSIRFDWTPDTSYDPLDDL